VSPGLLRSMLRGQQMSAENGNGSDLTGPARAGQILRDARISGGRSQDECAVALRSRTTQIDAMERGDLSIFGGDVYARGFLRSYARLVGVKEKVILDLHGHDPAVEVPAVSPRPPIHLRREPPGWLVGLFAIVVLAGVLGTVLLFGGRRAPDVIGAADPGLGAAGVTEPGTPAPAPAPPAPEPPEPVAGPPIDLVLTFEATSWLEVLVDGVVVERGALVQAGETLRFAGQELVVLRLGNAGGVRVESSGDDLGALGRSGEVLRVSFGPDGLLDGSR